MTFKKFLAAQTRNHTIDVCRRDLLKQVRQLGLARRQFSFTHDEITRAGEAFLLSRSSTITLTPDWNIEHGARQLVGTPHFQNQNTPAEGSQEECLIRHFAKPVTIQLPEPVVFDDNDYNPGGSGWVFRSQLMTRLKAELKHLEAL